MTQWIKNWFSNFLPFDEPMVYQGVEYRTVENFFQAMKVEKTNLDERRKIAAMSPSDAKRAGRRVKLRADWEDIKLAAMMHALKYKFTEGTSWYEQLKAHPEPIIETNNWHDNYWGSCICPKCGNKGRNELGKLIEKLR